MAEQLISYYDEAQKKYIEVSTTTPLPTSSTGGTGPGGATEVSITGTGGDAKTENGGLAVSEQGYPLLAANVLNVTTAGTRVQLPNIPCHEVIIIAKRGNTGSIYVGLNTVTAAIYGAEMVARDALTLDANNANEIWIDASVNGEGISYFIL